MKKLLLVVTALALAISGTLFLAPQRAEATLYNSSSLTRVAASNSGGYELWVRMAVDLSSDGQSARSYIGVECRQGGVRHTYCRVDLNDVGLSWIPPGACCSVDLRVNDFGIIPSTGWTAGFSRFGTWYNPSGTCFPAGYDVYSAASTHNAVRFYNGELKSFSGIFSLIKPLPDC